MEMFLFPFGKVKAGSRIIIYGYGKVGQSYLGQIKATKYCSVEYVVDKDAKQYKDIGIPIKEINELLVTISYDYVVIANSNILITDMIVDTLVKMGVNIECIITENIKLTDEIFFPALQAKYDRLEKSVNIISNMMEKMQVKYDQFERMITSIDSYSRNNFYGVNTYQTMHYKRAVVLKNLLSIKDHNKSYLCRIGRKHDGGYAMLNDFANTEAAYSFGISNDVSWDLDIAEMGIDVFMYDHTIAALPENHERFHFHQIGVADSMDDVSTELEPLSNIIVRNGHSKSKNLILKMDVEGCEWGALKMTSNEDLCRFKQIVLEIHGLTNELNFEEMCQVLEKMNENFNLIHIHANNYSNIVYIGDIALSDVMEITYIRKGIEIIAAAEKQYEDQKCWEARDENDLLNW